jgi:endonuclease/exonuclease/phosphatase family metal-dependent hydrolase
LAASLAMHAAYAPAQWQGNLLLSRAPLVDVKVLALATARAEVRSAVVARAVLDGQETRVACTHLDSNRESARVEQIVQLHRALSADATPTLMGGDFNALRLSDYPAEILEAVRQGRARARREPPANSVIDHLDGWGYLDAARLADAVPSYAVALTRPIDPSLRTTCHAGTRVDYVWLCPRLAAGVTNVRAYVPTTDVSDHSPLVVSWQSKSL